MNLQAIESNKGKVELDALIPPGGGTQVVLAAPRNGNPLLVQSRCSTNSSVWASFQFSRSIVSTISASQLRERSTQEYNVRLSKQESVWFVGIGEAA